MCIMHLIYDMAIHNTDNNAYIKSVVFVVQTGASRFVFVFTYHFWFTRIQANKAAIKAMLMNRIGDFGLALGIFCIFS